MIALRGLHPVLRPYAEALVAYANEQGMNVRITSVFRSMAQQQALRNNFELCVARGRFPSRDSYGVGMSCAWPANRPGDSGHNYGVAWDSVAEKMDDWTARRREAGGHVPPNDAIHAELPDWRQYLG